MSILDGLRRYEAEFIWAQDTGYETPMGDPLFKADDVREALINPTDEVVEAAAEAIYKSDGYEPGYSPEWPDEACDPHTYRRNARAALAAAAGGDDE